MDQNLAQTYYQDEKQKNKKARPWVYWVVLAVVAVVAMIVIELI